eukprot:CAMPEP_0170737660 /NCGR_PEP_ID=MMETSP0437-20130122/4240_1 /TAXON_ID=0 /ORGANISM="Sexangularia sp." /LENGTH=292 /DNA_ID=CAMNT_0011076051 /DNA_START=198 /DNA_END=1074 /DNA_ORIENTATION=-
MVRRTTTLQALHIHSADESSPFAPDCRSANINVSLDAVIPPVEALLRPQVRSALAAQVTWLLTQPKPIVALLGPAWLDESIFATDIWRGARPVAPFLANDFEDFLTLMQESVGLVAGAMQAYRHGLVYTTNTFGRAILEGARRYVASPTSNLTIATEFAFSPPASLVEMLQLIKSTGIRVILLGLGSEYMSLFAAAIANESMTSDDGYTYLVPHSLAPEPGLEEFHFIGQGNANAKLLSHVEEVLNTSSPDYLLADIYAVLPAIGAALSPAAWRCVPYDETRALVHSLNVTV